MLKKVKLYGELAERYGKDWYLDINSPAEAVRALTANNSGFKQFVSASEDRGMGYTIKVGESYVEDISEIHNPSGRQEIKIIPVVLGAKSKNETAVLYIILGAALIWFAPNLAAGLGEAFSMSEGAIATMEGAIMSQGASLILGGVAMLLAKPPEEEEEGTNYGFNGAKNTTKQGAAVPICYGQLMIGGAIISSGITAENYSP